MQRFDFIMRIGIFTLVGSTNYGGALQAFSLSEQLKSMGHQPEFIRVIDNKPTSRWRRLIGILTTYSLRELMQLAVSNRVLRKTKKHSIYNATASDTFNKFYETQITMPSHVQQQDLSHYVRRYDALIVGSDQVWTDLYANHLIFFFDLLYNYPGLRISYAACSAHSKAAIYNRKKIKDLLGRFNAISVRDCVTMRLAQRYTKKHVSLVADPTLLIDLSPYVRQRYYKKPYIFCYILGEEPKGGGHAEAIKKIKQKVKVDDIDVVAINRTGNDYAPYCNVEMNEADPFVWVNLIAHAEFVYTDSFHALLFSLRYHKLLLAYYTETIRASRLTDLRNYYRLGNNIVGTLKQWEFTELDWSYVDSRMQELSSSSKNFLKEALHG